MLSQALKASSASSSSNLLASSGSISAASLLECHSSQCSPAGALALHVAADEYALDSPKHIREQEQGQIDEEEPFWVTASTGSAEQPSPFAQDTSGLDALCRSFVANSLSHRCAATAAGCWCIGHLCGGGSNGFQAGATCLCMHSIIPSMPRECRGPPALPWPCLCLHAWVATRSTTLAAAAAVLLPPWLHVCSQAAADACQQHQRR